MFMPSNSPAVACFFPFPPPPMVSLLSLSLPTPPLNISRAGLIWMGQSTSLKMPSTVGLHVDHERKSMWIRQEICCLAFAPSCWLSPGWPCSSPGRLCSAKPALQRGVPVPPHSVGRAGGCQAELLAIQQRLLSPSSQPDPWAAHLEPPQVSRCSLRVQCK